MGESIREGGQGTASRLFLVGIVFVAGRFLLLPGSQPYSDVPVFYARYALEFERARVQGRTVYQERARAERARLEAFRQAHDTDPPAEGSENVEYPPLAMEFLRLPEAWMRQPTRKITEEGFVRAYEPAFRAGMAVVDAALCGLVIVLVPRLLGSEPPGLRLERMLAYLAATLALWPLLYDRMDLVLAFLVTLSFWLLVSGRNVGWSFGVLALAINFKVVPVVLAPVWVVGALPLSVAANRAAVLPRLATRTLLLAGLTAAVLAPFVVQSGWATLGFFFYHQGRGIEIDTLYSTLLMTLGPLGFPIEVYGSHNSINVRSAASPVVAMLPPLLMGGLLLAALLLLLRHARRLAAGSGEGTLAQRYPTDFAAVALLFLMLFVGANKVFSPQYLLWLAPLVALAPLRGASRRPFLWGFVLVCGLTTLLFPFLYWSDLAVHRSAGGFGPPTVRGAVLLGMRNVCFVALTGLLAIHLWKERGRPLSRAGEVGDL